MQARENLVSSVAKHAADVLIPQPGDRQKWLKDLSVKLSAKQLAAVRKAGGATLRTTITVTDATGTHTKTITKKIKVKADKKKAKNG